MGRDNRLPLSLRFLDFAFVKNDLLETLTAISAAELHLLSHVPSVVDIDYRLLSLRVQLIR
jgi:hypothetical protein